MRTDRVCVFQEPLHGMGRRAAAPPFVLISEGVFWVFSFDLAVLHMQVEFGASQLEVGHQTLCLWNVHPRRARLTHRASTCNRVAYRIVIGEQCRCVGARLMGAREHPRP